MAYDKLKSNPHPDIDNHLLNIVLSIAIVSRAFNGESLLSSEFYHSLTSICIVFKEKKQIFGSMTNAFNSVVEQALRLDKELYIGYTKIFTDDGLKIFSNKFYVIESLMVLYDIL